MLIKTQGHPPSELELRFLKSVSLSDEKVETPPTEDKAETPLSKFGTYVFLKSVSLSDEKVETPPAEDKEDTPLSKFGTYVF